MRPCRHVTTTRPLSLQSIGCGDCLAIGEVWTELSFCLSCGWLACGDNSPRRHAEAHYQETDHPVAVAVDGTPDPVRWCYVHQRAV